MKKMQEKSLLIPSGQRVLTTAILLSAGVFSATANAEPIVSGNVITGLDDGWYQVQNASTYQSICEGLPSCEVEAGTYIIINHSTGTRYENVEVTGGNEPPEDIVVEGNTLSWPDDGWYQVQSASSYATICEGTRSCDVEDGIYNVINLTSGMRYDGIKVGSETSEGVRVLEDGVTIAWPNDGWYQVQSADTYETICSGGRSCVVEAGGTYNVINHTTSERFENIVTAIDLDPEPVFTEEESIALLRDAFGVFTGQAYKDPLFRLPGYSDDYVPLTSTWYEDPIPCFNEGEYEYQPIWGGLEDGGSEDSYFFYECDDGISVLNGSFQIIVYPEISVFNGQDFSRTSSGETWLLSGTVRFDPSGDWLNGGENHRGWAGEFDSFSYSGSSSLIELSDVDTSFDYNRYDSGTEVVVSSISGGFDMLTDNTAGEWVSVVISEELRATGSNSFEGMPLFNTGELYLSNESGTWLLLDADISNVYIIVGDSRGYTETFFLEWSVFKDSLTPVSY